MENENVCTFTPTIKPTIMKRKFTILTSVLLLCISVSSQTLAINETDTATGSRIIKTNNITGAEHSFDDSVVKRGVIFFSAGYQSSKAGTKSIETYYIDLNIVHHDNRLGCLEQLKSSVLLFLDDGTKMECFQISDTDCDADAYYASFALMPRNGDPEVMKQNFEKLIHTGISRIDLLTSETTVVYRTKKSSSEYMTKHFALIDKTIKGSTK